MSHLTYEQEASSRQSQIIAANIGGPIISSELSRYLVVSTVALAADVGFLYTLSAGLGAHYLVCQSHCYYPWRPGGLFRLCSLGFS